MTIVTFYASDALQRRLVDATVRADCSEAEWINEAVTWALEQDEAEPSATITHIYYS